MRCKADIVNLSETKFKAAECLLNDGHFDDAYYIAGYVIELLLKAKVCETLAIPDFFDFSSRKFQVKNIDSIYRSYKVHEYNQLLVLSGLYHEFQTEANSNPLFKAHWSIVSLWDENCRYLTGKSQKEVQNFLISVNEIASWIKKRL